MFFIFGQILTLISYLIFWYSRFKKDKKNILLLDNVSRIFAIVAFIFLGTYDGIKNTVFVILRNFLGQITDKKKTLYKITTFLLMLSILIIMYVANFNGISTICIAICGIANLYGTIMCNAQGIRIFGMIGSGFYTTFMILTGNTIGIICEIICFTVMLISFLKYRKIQNH